MNEGYGKMGPNNLGYGIKEPHQTGNKVAFPEPKYAYGKLKERHIDLIRLSHILYFFYFLLFTFYSGASMA